MIIVTVRYGGMKRISDDRSAITDPGELERLNYARSEVFHCICHLLLLICSRNSSLWRRLMK